MKTTYLQKYRLLSAEAFRCPMYVSQALLFRNGDIFPICPRCQITLEREYQKFCDRCGQALNWDTYSNAQLIRNF